jgi:stage V sporulation protein SpoVS
MVVSNAPAIIGGAPDKKELANYSKIAFMGQVPVKVLGQVCKGDYILPSGKGDGMAMAVAPENMKTLDYRRVIGVAWSESQANKAFSFINTAVGLNTNDLAIIVDQMQNTINEMQLVLQKLVPEYNPTLFATTGKSGSLVVDKSGYSKAPSMREALKQEIDQKGHTNLKEAMQVAKQYVNKQGVDLKDYPYLSELFDNPTVETAVKAQVHYMAVLAKAESISKNMPNRK